MIIRLTKVISGGPCLFFCIDLRFDFYTCLFSKTWNFLGPILGVMFDYWSLFSINFYYIPRQKVCKTVQHLCLCPATQHQTNPFNNCIWIILLLLLDSRFSFTCPMAFCIPATASTAPQLFHCMFTTAMEVSIKTGPSNMKKINYNYFFKILNYEEYDNTYYTFVAGLRYNGFVQDN